MKSYGSATAVDELHLTIGTGSSWGLVGPNGAGKTTLLSMAVGLLRPDAGNAFVHGHPVWGREAGEGRRRCWACCPTVSRCRAG
jgi:ABC-2 type transport system ATP-binding protein